MRLKIAGDRISEIETLVTHEGEGAPFQPEGYLWREAPFIREVEMRHVDTRSARICVVDGFGLLNATTPTT